MHKLSATHRKILTELLALPTAPFREQLVIGYVRQFCRRRNLPIRADRFGNLLVRYRTPGRRRARPLAFSAHMDHPGFELIRPIGPGRVLARWRGGVGLEYFRAARVRFWNGQTWVRGRIRAVSREKVSPGQPARVNSVTVDLPLRAELPVGAIGMWDLPEPRIRGSRIYARDCDDIAGVASMLCMLETLSRRRIPAEAYCMFTRAEEVGFAGCLSACRARTLPNKCAVVGIECSSLLAGAQQGAGPVLRVGDRMSVFSPALEQYVRALAQKLVAQGDGFAYQRKLMDAGACESTAYCAYGYQTTGICLALGNYHNMDVQKRRIAPEYIHLGDFANMVRWFVALASARERFEPRTGAANRKKLDPLRRRFERTLLRTTEHAGR